MIVYLIRNAEHEKYKERAWPLRDTGLSENGKWQSNQITRRLGGTKITSIHSSTLSRAVQTVNPLAMWLGLEIVESAAFDAIGMGDFDGRTYAETVNSMGEDNWKEMLTSPVPAKRYFANGETLCEASERAYNQLMQIANAAREPDVVVICSHEEIIGALMCKMAGMNLKSVWWWGGRVTPAAYANVTEINYSHGRWGLVSFGMADHLRR